MLEEIPRHVGDAGLQPEEFRQRTPVVLAWFVFICLTQILGFSPREALSSQISLQQKATGETSGGTSVSASFASAPSSGNLLVAIAGNRASSTPSTPSGWSIAIDQSANSPGQIIFYKIAGSSEATTVTVNGWSASTFLGLTILEYVGIDRASPLDATASTIGNASPTSSGTASTTQRSQELVIAGFTKRDEDAYTSWTSSFAEQSNFQNAGTPPSSRCRFAVADRIVTTTGSYSTTASYTVCCPDWRGQIVTFKGDRRVMIIN